MASYYDALERAMPHNCSIDFSTAIKFFDDSVKSGNDTLIQLLKNDVLQAVTGSSERVTFKDSDESTPVDIAEWLRSVIPDIQVRIIRHRHFITRLICTCRTMARLGGPRCATLWRQMTNASVRLAMVSQHSSPLRRSGLDLLMRSQPLQMRRTRYKSHVNHPLVMWAWADYLLQHKINLTVLPGIGR
jgi:hypothetical protein